MLSCLFTLATVHIVTAREEHADVTDVLSAPSLSRASMQTQNTKFEYLCTVCTSFTPATVSFKLATVSSVVPIQSRMQITILQMKSSDEDAVLFNHSEEDINFFYVQALGSYQELYSPQGRNGCFYSTNQPIRQDVNGSPTVQFLFYSYFHFINFISSLLMFVKS